MATLAHPRTDGFGRRDISAESAAVLDRAMRVARSHVRPRRGVARLLLGRRASAAALIRRYRLRGAILAAYERIARELGPPRVEITAEESAGEVYVAMDCWTDEPDVDRVIDVEDAVQRQVHAELGDRRWLRLLVTINPGPARFST
ncbi:MAG TPA: hypothetical protein VF092_28035 [Longimicrobium sp.]